MKRAAYLMLFAVLACGDDPPVEIPPTGVLLEDLAAELAAADCARLAECGTIPAPFDVEACTERQRHLRFEPIAEAISAGVTAGSLAYFELSAKDCVDRIGDLDCSVGLEHDVLGEPICTQMLRANGTAGAACPLALACQSGLFCGGTTCPGTCTAFKTNNEACDFGQPCAEGLYCDLTAHRCLVVAAANQACALSIGGNSCATGTFCDQSSPTAPTCKPVRGRGQGCGDDFECIAGSRCVLARCSAGVIGDGCQTNDDCEAGLYCVGTACRAPIAVGEACTMTGAPCVDGAACFGDLMTCAALPTAGQGCGDPGCWLSRCTARLCVAAALDGKACTTAEDCLPGRSCQGQICTSSFDCH